MISQAASFCVVRGSLVSRATRYRRMPGTFSSDFLWRVHLLAAVSRPSSMSSAMVRGRSCFCCLVIGLLRVVGDDDRALAAVGKLDVGRRQVHGADHRLP